MPLAELTPERAAYLEGCSVTEERLRQELVDALDLHGGTDWAVALAYATRAGKRLRATEDRNTAWNAANLERVRETNREAARRYREGKRGDQK